MATLLQGAKLLYGLFTGDVARTGPFYVDIDVTHRCNLQCLCCRHHSPLSGQSLSDRQTKAEFPFDLFARLCGELKAMDTGMVILAGAGEPLLHTRVFDLISVAKENGLRVMLFTNGVLLDENRVARLVDTELDVLKVSLWASSAEEYVQNHPGVDPASFDSILEGLRLLASRKAERKSRVPSVEISHPLNRHNFQKLDALIELAGATGCNKIHFSPLNTHGGRFSEFALSPDEEESLYLSLHQVEERLKSDPLAHNVDELLLRYRIGNTLWRKLPCYIGWYHAQVKVDGTVIACHEPMGNINTDRFSDIWNGSAYRAFRRRMMALEDAPATSKYHYCSYCCHVLNNYYVHRVFRWFSPLCRYFKRASAYASK